MSKHYMPGGTRAFPGAASHEAEATKRSTLLTSGSDVDHLEMCEMAQEGSRWESGGACYRGREALLSLLVCVG